MKLELTPREAMHLSDMLGYLAEDDNYTKQEPAEQGERRLKIHRRIVGAVMVESVRDPAAAPL